jgi:hypothetical protein
LDLGAKVTYYSYSGTNKNIYILDVGDKTNSNTRVATFTGDRGDGGGYIEIRGGYTSSGALTLNPGTGGVWLNGADIDLGPNDLDIANANKNVSLYGDSKITAAGITLGGTVTGAYNLTLDSGVNDISVTGEVGTSGTHLGDIVVEKAKHVTFDSAVYAAGFRQLAAEAGGLTLFKADQEYNGPNTGDYAFRFNGEGLRLDGNLTTSGTNGQVEINNTGDFTQTGGTITSSGAFSQTTTSVMVHLANGIATTNNAPENASVSFTGAIELTGDIVTMSTPVSGGDITLAGDLTRDGTVRDLTLSAGAGKVDITGAVGNSAAPLGVVTVSSADTGVTVSDTVNAAQVEITSKGPVVINSAVTVSGPGNKIELTSTADKISGAGLLTGTSLTAAAETGISLTNPANNVETLVLKNNASGHIVYDSSRGTGNSLTLSAENGASGGNITITEASGNLAAENSMSAIKAEAAGTINLTAAAGSISYAGSISGGTLNADAQNGIALDNADNDVETVDLYNGTAGDIVYNSSRGAGNTLTVTAENEAAAGGNITVTEVDGNLEVGTGAGTRPYAIHTAMATGTIALTAREGSITQAGLSLQTGSISGGEKLIAAARNGITLDNGLNNIETVELNNNGTAGNIKYNSSRGAGNVLTVTAANAATNVGERDITITEASGALVAGPGASAIRTEAGDITLIAGKSVTQTGTISTQGTLDVTVSGAASTDGIDLSGDNLYNYNSVNTFKGNTSAGGGDILFWNAIPLFVGDVNASASGNITIASLDAVTVLGKLTTRGELSVESGDNKDITFESALTPPDSLAGTPSRMDIQAGEYDAPGNVYIKANLIMEGNDDASITIKAQDVYLDPGYIIQANKGNIYVNLANQGSSSSDITFVEHVAALSGKVFIQPWLGTKGSGPPVIYYTGTAKPNLNAHLPAGSPPPLFVESGGSPGIFTIDSIGGDIYLVNVNDGTDRQLTLEAGDGFIEFYESYTYTGSNPNHLILGSANAGVQTYHSGTGTADINLGAAVFAVHGVDLTIIEGSASIAAADIDLPAVANDPSNTGAGSGNLTLAADTIAVSGTVGTGSAPLGVITVNSAGAAAFTETADPAIYAAGFVMNSPGVTTGNIAFSGGQKYSGDFTFSGTSLEAGKALDAGGDITIHSAKDAAFAAGVKAAGFTQNAGTGTTVFNGPQTYIRGFAFTGTNLKVKDTLDAGGAVSVNNSGAFAAAGAITAGDDFSQIKNGTAGTVSIGAGITTAVNPAHTKASIAFADTVDLTGDVKMDSSAGNGTITLSGNVTAGTAQNLTLDAGSGNIAVTGTVGTAGAALGAVAILRAEDAEFTAAVTAAGFIQSAGTGTTVFNDTQDYTGDFTFTGANLTVNKALNAGGAVTVKNTGAFITSTAGTIGAGGVFSQSGGGTNSIGASISAASGTAGIPAIGFAQDAALTADLVFTAVPQAANQPGISLAALSGGGINLTLDAGTGNIAVSGTVGDSSAPLGIIKVVSVNDAAFGGDVWAASFDQSDTAGTGSGGSGLTRFDGVQDYAGGFTFIGTNLTVNKALSAGGDFAFTGTDLAVNGTLTAGGTITIPSANNVAFSAAAAVTAAGFTQNIGTGTTVFNAAQEYSGGFAFTGIILTVNAALKTDTDSTGGDGAVTVTLSGAGTPPPLFTVGASGSLQPGGPGGKITVNGNTVNNGTITASPDIASGETIVFDGNYEVDPAVTGPRSLVGNTGTATSIVFKGDVVFDAFTHNGAAVKFSDGTDTGSGPVTTHNVSRTGGGTVEMADVVIDAGNTVKVLPAVSGAAVVITTVTQIDDSTLTIGSSAILDTVDGIWYIGQLPLTPPVSPWYMLSNPSFSDRGDPNYKNPGSAFTRGFAGFNGTLTMKNDAELITGDFYTRMTDTASTPAAHIFTLIVPSGAQEMCYINASGNVTINETFSGTGTATVTNSTLTMTGDGKKLAVRGVSSTAIAADLGHFTADAAGGTIVNSDIIVKGNVIVNAGKKLYAADPSGLSNQNNYIRVEKDWTNDDNGTPDIKTDDGVFFPQKGMVEFGDHKGSQGRTFVISGNTSWYDLVCVEPAATLVFSNYPDLHSVAHAFLVEPEDQNGNLLGGGGAATNPYAILLTRKDFKDGGGTYPWAPHNDATEPPPAVDENFWYFELQSGAELSLHYVYIQYSWAKNRIPLPLSSTKVILATPYVNLDNGSPNYALATPRDDTDDDFTDSRNESFYNHNWLVTDYFFYSFTEDSDGNGRIDRIRVQAAFDLTSSADNAFDQFKVAVDGYEVDTSRGTNGYARVDEDPMVPSAVHARVRDMIYIYLIEKDYSDTGTRITWRVEENESLLDFATKSVPIGLPKHPPLTAWDTAPPRIGYALTLPADVNQTAGSPGEIYVQFSEPVVNITVTDPPVPVHTGTIKDVPGSDDSEKIVLLSKSYTPVDLIAVPEFTVTGVRDKAVYVDDVRSDPTQLYAYLFPSPKYPKNWTYTDYVEITGNGSLKPFDTVPPTYPAAGVVTSAKFDPALYPVKTWVPDYAGNFLDNTGNGDGTPGNPLYGTDTHRVTDVLVSVPPKDGYDSRYFVWPIWARYLEPANAGNELADNDFWGQDPTDTGIIWEFNGKKYLEERDTVLEWKINTGSTHTPIVPDAQLVYDFNAPSKFRAQPRNGVSGHGNTSLWLPAASWAGLPNPPFANLTPYFNTPFYRSGDLRLPVGAGNGLWTYTFKADDPEYESAAMLDFFFHLNGTPDDIFAARLDILPGAAIPQDWYRLVRPFSFEIHDITLQRSGVTILNNVINPDNGESVYVHYKLVKGGQVTVQVFTMDGTMVDVLYRGRRDPGEYRAVWKGVNTGGRAVARGMYFIRIVGPDIDEIRKVMVVR